MDSMTLSQLARLGRAVVVAALALAVVAPAASAGEVDRADRVADRVTEVEKPAEEKAGEPKPAGGAPCADRVLSRVFTPWHDRALYTLAPGGDFETQAEGWTLEGPAAIAADSSPFLLGEALGVGSLELPAGATAVSPPICVQRGFKSFRFLARSVGAPEGLVEAGDDVVEAAEDVVEAEKGVLKVQVVYADGKTKKAGRLSPGFEWAPTRKISLAQGRFRVRRRGSALVQLRFAAIAGTVRVDDVYVDPRYHR
jgi:hypothetical protein